MEGLLSLRGIWLSYRRGRRHTVRVLRGISLDVQPGEVVAVLAQRAQGKTSMLRIAAGMQRPDGGSATFEGRDMWPHARARARWAPRRRRTEGSHRGIALVRAVRPDVDVPALESIALPLAAEHGARAARLRAAHALEEVGASDCRARRWRDLENSERARVVLAQALAREPKLLLIDDLTATLHLADTGQVTELVHALARARGIAVLMSVGDARATGWCDRIGTLSGGDLLVAPALSAPSNAADVIDFPAR